MENCRYPATAIGKTRPAAVPRSRNLTKGRRVTSASGNRPAAALPRTPLQPSGGQFPNKLPEFGADTPMGRPGQPAELAPIYVLLATNEDSYSTGQVYGAVGGNGGP